MSFLSSVLGSINSGKAQLAAPQVPVKKRETDGGNTNEPTSGTKRKASGELQRPSDKLTKSPSRPISSGRPDAAKLSSTSGRPAQRPSNPATVRQSAESSTSGPKKGSFKEILARAQQNSTSQIGQLTHKAKEKEKLSTKKELRLQRELAQRGKKPRHTQGNPNSTPGKSTASLPSKTVGVKPLAGRKDTSAPSHKGPAKPRVQPTYQGTAKPKVPAPAYRGTMKPRDTPQTKRGYDSEPGRGRDKPAGHQRGGYSDYDSEEGSEDGYDYASEDYSDMDAGFDDVDEEEAEAERQAKKEDIREQKMLDELAKQKEDRKRRAQQAPDKERKLKR